MQTGSVAYNRHMYLYEPYDVPKYDAERYREGYHALAQIAEASEQQIADIDELQKLSAFIGNFAVQVTDVAFSYHRPMQHQLSTTPIPNFLNANAVDMTATRGFHLNKEPHSDVLRVGAGNAGTIVDVAHFDPLSRRHMVGRSIHIAAGPVPTQPSEDEIEHWSAAEDPGARVHPLHPLFQKPEYWQLHARTLRDLTRLVIAQVPKVS